MQSLHRLVAVCAIVFTMVAVVVCALLAFVMAGKGVLDSLPDDWQLVKDANGNLSLLVFLKNSIRSLIVLLLWGFNSILLFGAVAGIETTVRNL